MHNYQNDPMSSVTSPIRDFFAKLDLEPEIADIYVALHRYGAQTLSELARTSGVERTRIYRLTDRLAELSLIEQEVRYKRRILRAAPLTNLRLLIIKREESLARLWTELSSVEQLLAPTAGLSLPTMRIQSYHGPEGLKQMFWNETKGHTENLAILYENMQMKTNAKFFERWVLACNEHGIAFRGIVGEHFLASQRAWYAKHHTLRLANWQARQIAEEVFPIRYSTVIYDDVVAYYTWLDEEVFGTELYSQDIADAHRRWFDMLWRQAEPIQT